MPRAFTNRRSPKTDPVVFDQKHCVFLTHVLGVTVGETIDIKNSDPIGHNTNIMVPVSIRLFRATARFRSRCKRKCSVPIKVKCSIHPWMTAYMLPRKNGYFAVTDDQGKFEIANVPAGEPLEFQVWHESGTAPGSGLVGTTPDATDVKWSNRGRITVTLQPDEEERNQSRRSGQGVPRVRR